MDLIGTARNPVPAGVQKTYLVARDGMRLRAALWLATAGDRQGTVCVFQGRAEFIEKYFETIADLRRRGFAVATMDWRGQGGSGRRLRNPRKGHVEDFSQYDGDLELFMTEFVLPDCPPPYFALAHSMGGNILLRAATRRDCWFERMVLSAPMLGLAGDKPSVPGGAALTELAVFCGLGDMVVPDRRSETWETVDFEGNPFTSDEGRFRRNREVLEREPSLGLGSPTIAWARAAFASMKWLTSDDFPASVHVPALILSAGQDQIVSNCAIELLASRLKAGSEIVIRRARHELLQEKDSIREQVWAAFDAFVPGK